MNKRVELWFGVRATYGTAPPNTSANPERVKTREFRMRLARMIAGVNERPVEVLQHGEPVAVLVSPADFDELKRLRQVYTPAGSKHRTA